jgi:aromatic-L-amino-acid decarboxylase
MAPGARRGAGGRRPHHERRVGRQSDWTYGGTGSCAGGGARADGLQGRQSPLTLYASEEAHSSIDKAVSQLGLGTRHLRQIPTDERFQLRMNLLRTRVAEDREDGRTPFCVVASAGTVTTGSVDPLDAIATLCAEQGLWLHVDGAYGALSAVSERFKGPLQGLQRANLISLDPHKFLFTSFEAGCVLVSNLGDLEHFYKVMPSDLSKETDPDFLNFSDLGPQLSRGFKALKIWWSLRYFGKAAYVAAVERMADLAQYMGQLASATTDFELVAPVTFNAVCFRVARWLTTAIAGCCGASSRAGPRSSARQPSRAASR